MGVEFAGIPLLLEDDDGEIAEWCSAYLPMELPWWPDWSTMNAARAGALPFPAYPPMPKPRLNTIYHPTGASRWTFGVFLVEESRLDSILSATGPTYRGDLVIEWDVDVGSSGTPEHAGFTLPEMRLIFTRRISSPDGDFWVIVLVDDRYFWQQQGVTFAAGALENDEILDAFAEQLDYEFSYSEEDLNADVEIDKEAISQPGSNAALMLDSFCLAHGLRVCFQFADEDDEDITASGFNLVKSMATGAGPRAAGRRFQGITAGGWDDTNTSGGINDYFVKRLAVSIPESVIVLFPSATGSGDCGGAYQVEVSATDALYPANGGAKTAQGFKPHVWSDVRAEFEDEEDETPTNGSDLTTIATALAQSWYAAKLSPYTAVALNGLAQIDHTPGDDSIEWRLEQRLKDGRIVCQTIINPSPLQWMSRPGGVPSAGGGSDIIEGFLTSDLAGSTGDGTNETTATMDVWSGDGAAWASTGSTETVTNRDDSLSGTSGAYIQARRAGTEWRPVWLSCSTQNEIQRLTITGTPTGGTITVSFEGEEIIIPFDATAPEIYALLTLASSIGPANVDTTGGDLPGTAVDIEFINDLSNTDVPMLLLVSNDLTGGTDPDATITLVQSGCCG